jgi:drug/metabolite transporter (DMT)-like permease
MGVVLFEAWFPIAMMFTVPVMGLVTSFFYATLLAAVTSGVWLVLVRSEGGLWHAQGRWDLVRASLLASLVYLALFGAILNTHPGHVALVLVLQVLFSYLFFQSRAEERVSSQHLLGVVMMFVGGVLLLWPQGAWNWGDWLILIAAMLGPWLSYYQKRAKVYYSTPQILLTRYGMSLLIVVLLMFLGVGQLEYQWDGHLVFWLVFMGVFVFVVSKALWIEALMRMPITRLNALIVVAPLLTMALDYFLFDYWPSRVQLIALPLIFLGALILIKPNPPISCART